MTRQARRAQPTPMPAAAPVERPPPPLLPLEGEAEGEEAVPLLGEDDAVDVAADPDMVLVSKSALLMFTVWPCEALGSELQALSIVLMKFPSMTLPSFLRKQSAHPSP